MGLLGGPLLNLGNQKENEREKFIEIWICNLENLKQIDENIKPVITRRWERDFYIWERPKKGTFFWVLKFVGQIKITYNFGCKSNLISYLEVLEDQTLRRHKFVVKEVPLAALFPFLVLLFGYCLYSITIG